MHNSLPRRPVAHRLASRLAVIGVVLAALTALVQYTLEYRRDLAGLHARLDEIQTSYLPSVRENAWLDDRDRLAILAEGMQGLEGIAQVEVIAPDGTILAKAGHPALQPLEQSWELVRDYADRPVPLGRLVVIAGLETLEQTALHQMGFTLAANMLLLLVLGALLYWQVHTLVTSPLDSISGYARRLGRDGPLATPVREPSPASAIDEFTDMASALTRMHQDIAIAQDALAAGEARYRELFTSSPVPLWEQDYSAVGEALEEIPTGADVPAWLAANPDFVRRCAGLVRTLDVNDATLALHRATGRDEMLGRPTAVFTSAAFDAFRQRLEAIHAGVWDLTQETQLRTLDGDVRDVALHWHVPPTQRSTLARVIVATEDVSPLKAARRSSEMTLERLMVANSELERFTFVASHDLQEPVRAVVSFTQLLERRLAEADHLSADLAEFLGFLKAAARRMQAQVAGLQDYARAGQASSFTIVALDEVLAELRTDLDATLAGAGGRIEAGPLPKVQGDRTQLALLFRHLLDNSIKFRRLGTPLVIAISAHAAGAFWRITVRDNGTGIEPGYAATVFELFRRLHGPSEFPGAGLGLTICRRIVDMHGGTIAVDPTATGGTAIAFTLPASDLATKEAAT